MTERKAKMTERTHCTGAGCARQWEVSEEDPDATMGDMLDHAHRKHPAEDPAKILKEGPRP